MIDANSNQIISVSNDYDSSIHDKTVFEMEYARLHDKLDKELTILGDKAYIGLEEFNVKTPIKKNHREYKQDKIAVKNNNRELSQKRIKIEHTFARLKSFAILHKPVYYSRRILTMFVKSIANIVNLSY